MKDNLMKDAYDTGYRDGANAGYNLAKTELKPLVDAAIKTLNDNLHLCDGDVCTLYDLKKAVEQLNHGWLKG